MRRLPFRLRTVLLAGLALLVAAQAIPYGPSRTNPPVVAEPQWDSPMTRDLAHRACFDCHSNETEWPVYSGIAPVSWLVARDVEQGRSVLNLSEWQRPQEEAREAAETVTEGEMPLRLYTLMHSHARLSDVERAALARGLAATLGTASAAGDER